jgi:hypothetical protein
LTRHGSRARSQGIIGSVSFTFTLLQQLYSVPTAATRPAAAAAASSVGHTRERKKGETKTTPRRGRADGARTARRVGPGGGGKGDLQAGQRRPSTCLPVCSLAACACRRQGRRRRRQGRLRSGGGG